MLRGNSLGAFDKRVKNMGMAEAENTNVVARLDDYRPRPEPPGKFTLAEYQKALAELSAAASSILAVTEILARIGPPPY